MGIKEIFPEWSPPIRHYMMRHKEHYMEFMKFVYQEIILKGFQNTHVLLLDANEYLKRRVFPLASIPKEAYSPVFLENLHKKFTQVGPNSVVFVIEDVKKIPKEVSFCSLTMLSESFELKQDVVFDNFVCMAVLRDYLEKYDTEATGCQITAMVNICKSLGVHKTKLFYFDMNDVMIRTLLPVQETVELYHLSKDQVDKVKSLMNGENVVVIVKDQEKLWISDL